MAKKDSKSRFVWKEGDVVIHRKGTKVVPKKRKTKVVKLPKKLKP